MSFDKDDFYISETLEGWVGEKCQSWRDYYEANYSQRFDEYYRLWRGQWSHEDKTRESERSRIVSPALQQAVESSVAELEEATFGVVSGLILKMICTTKTHKTLLCFVVT